MLKVWQWQTGKSMTWTHVQHLFVRENFGNSFFCCQTPTSTSKFSWKKAISFLICCKCHTCVNMLSTATLSSTHKSVSDSVTSICIPFIWTDLRGPPPPALLFELSHLFFISAESRVYCQISGLKAFMVKPLRVLAWTLSRSVVLWSAVSHYEDGRRGSTEGSADRDSLRSCTYCCRPASRVWALFVVKHSEDPQHHPP